MSCYQCTHSIYTWHKCVIPLEFCRAWFISDTNELEKYNHKRRPCIRVSYESVTSQWRVSYESVTSQLRVSYESFTTLPNFVWKLFELTVLPFVYAASSWKLYILWNVSCQFLMVIGLEIILTLEWISE